MLKLWLILLTLFFLGGCDSSKSPEESSAAKQSIEEPKVSKAEVAVPKTSVEDLDGIRKHGVLRILVPSNTGGQGYLPRKGSPVEEQRRLAEEFALSQGLKAEIIPVDGFFQFWPVLLEGKGDLVASNLTVTEERLKKVGFTVPLTHIREQLLIRADNDDVKNKADLNGLRVMAHSQAAYWRTLQKWKLKYPDMVIRPRPAGLSDEGELDLLAAGEIDAVVRDSNIAQMYLGYRDDIKVAFNLGPQKKIAWAIRPDNPKLLAALNQFLYLSHPEYHADDIHQDDLAGIKKRRVLRVLLRNNGASYFLYKGELMGFEYDMAKAMADSLKVRLDVVVTDSHEQMFEWIREGKADIAANFIEPIATDLTEGLAFSRPYHFAARHLVVRVGSRIKTPNDLIGHTVLVRRSSAYWKTLELLRATGINFNIEAADERLDTEDLMQMVAEGKITATVADGHMLDIELARGTTVRSAFTLGDQRGHAVVMRKDSKELLEAVNGFIKQNYRSTVYNILRKKYFKNTRRIQRVAAARQETSENYKLSPYDHYVRQLAHQYSFDWRLITAQMFQESRFNPEAQSFAGAVGLMQVLPRTAESMGFKKFETPQQGIHAGIKYLNWLRNRFEENLAEQERIWFSLAAYNAGLGHVIDARKLAQSKGWNANRWFGHTERAMLLLRQKEYAAKARHGWVRGGEPVLYVRNIRQRFKAYINIINEDKAAGVKPEWEIDEDELALIY